MGGVQYAGAMFPTCTRGVYSGITGGDQQQIQPATPQYVSSPVAVTQSLCIGKTWNACVFEIERPAGEERNRIRGAQR